MLVPVILIGQILLVWVIRSHSSQITQYFWVLTHSNVLIILKYVLLFSIFVKRFKILYNFLLLDNLILQISLLVASSTNNGIKREYIEHAVLYTVPAYYAVTDFISFEYTLVHWHSSIIVS